MDLSQEDEKALATIRGIVSGEDNGIWRGSTVTFLLRILDTERRKVEVLERVAKVCETCEGEGTIARSLHPRGFEYDGPAPCPNPNCEGGAVSLHAERLRAADRLAAAIHAYDKARTTDKGFSRICDEWEAALAAYDAAVKQEQESEEG